MVDDYPEAFAPILPVLSRNGWSFSGDRSSSVFLSSDCHFLHGARYALLSGLQSMGVAADDHVLLPAYHCYSIIEPFVQQGCQVEFYKLNFDLSVNLVDLAKRLRATTRAVLITHYFAMPQPVIQVLDTLKKSSALLIEDCAHAFFGQLSGGQLGSFGAFSVASGKKFFPLEDGGFLKFNCIPETPVGFVKNPLKHNLKLLVNSLEKSAQYKRLRPLSDAVRFLTDSLHRLKPSSPTVATAGGEQQIREEQHDLIYIDQQLINRFGSCWSEWIMRHTDLDQLQEKRRGNFQLLLSGLNELTTAKPLYPSVPDQVVPYAFPLLLDDPERHFPLLKKAGVPMWRWEDVQLSHCVISKDYRHRLIQLPCHQGMKNVELSEIIENIRNVLCA